MKRWLSVVASPKQALRDIAQLIEAYGGNCWLYDYRTYLRANNDSSQKRKAAKTRGLTLEDKIVYLEDENYR